MRIPGRVMVGLQRAELGLQGLMLGLQRLMIGLERGEALAEFGARGVGVHAPADSGSGPTAVKPLPPRTRQWA